MRGDFDTLRRHALAQATAKEYVRRSQERLAVACGDVEAVEQHLLILLESQRDQSPLDQGYAPGNVINLLRLLRGNLRGLDLARLAIRQAY